MFGRSHRSQEPGGLALFGAAALLILCLGRQAAADANVADLDTDGDVDQGDVAVFMSHFAGPGVIQSGAALLADFTGDQDVDQEDFGFLQNLLGWKAAGLLRPVVTCADSTAAYNALLGWNATPGASSYNVYFDADPSPEYAGNTTKTTFDPGLMTRGRTYYWRIDPVINGTPVTGVLCSFTVRGGSLKLLDEVSDVDLEGSIIYGINCGKSGPVSDASIVINHVLYRPDVLVTGKEYLALDTNGSGNYGSWHNSWYNATNPGKPVSPTPIWGMTVRCSDEDTNGMDHGPYESIDRMRVTSTIFPGQGRFYTGVYPPADDPVQGLRYLLYHVGTQNLGELGDRNMAFSFDTIPGNSYKLQLLFFYPEQLNGDRRALNLYIRPNNAVGFIHPYTIEQPDLSINITDQIAALGGSVRNQSPSAGLVFTYEFEGESDGTLDFEITRNPGDAANVGCISAIILEDTSPVATNPTPMNGQYNTSWKQKLSWDPATGALLHDVYFGTDYEAVRTANRNSPEFVGPQVETTYDPGPLLMGTTYFWRVDEVAATGIITTGETWSFTPDTDTGGYKIINTAAGEWIEHHDVRFPAGDFRFTAHLSTTSPGQSVRLELNGDAQSYSFPVALPNTGGFMREIHLGHAGIAAGRYDMRFVFLTGGVELDYFFVRRSSDTTAAVLPEDTLLVRPSGPMELSTIMGSSDHKPVSGWPYSVLGGYGYDGYEFSMDIFSNHDAYNQQFYDYHVDCMLSARIHAVQPHGAGLWDPMGVDDQGPFLGVRPTLPRLIKAINRRGGREFLRIAQFDVAAGQVREYYENNGSPTPKFNVQTDLDQYHYWYDYSIKPFWSMVPRDMWHRRDGYAGWYAWWDAPQPGGWWDPPTSFNGLLNNWIDFMRNGFFQTFGENLYFVGVGAQYVDNTITMDDVQAICPLMTVEEDSYIAWPGHFGIGQWNRGRGAGVGNKYGNTASGFRSFDYDDKTGCVNSPTTFCTEYPRHNYSTRKSSNPSEWWPVHPELPEGAPILGYGLGRMLDEGAVWVNIESWDDKDEDTSLLPSTDTRVFNYPNEFINILREYGDPQMLSVRFEAELFDYHYDTTPGNGGTPFWKYRSDPDSVAGAVERCNADIDRITGSDIGVAVNPYPLDCEVGVPPDVTLTWAEPYGAQSYVLYFSTDRNAVTYGSAPSVVLTAGSYTPGGLVPGVTYYWRVDAVYGSTAYPSKTWQFSLSNPAAQATTPVHAATMVPVGAILAWQSGDGAVSHNVYFSTDYHAVLNGLEAAYKGNQTANSYDPPGNMAYGTTYYWRIDEVSASTTTPGPVWAFTTEAGSLRLITSFSDIDLSGNMVYTLNCGSTSNVTVGSLSFKGDVDKWHSQAGDVNGDGTVNWWDTRYNANCPGKPASPSPISGVTVECSDPDTNGMDHGPYEASHTYSTTSLFSGQGTTAAQMRTVLSTSGTQNLGYPGERDMIYRLNVTPGNSYQLQLLFFKNSTDRTGMDVLVENALVIRGLDIYSYISAGGGSRTNTVLLYKQNIVAADGQIDIVIRRNASLGSNVGDINAITLEGL